MNHINQDFDPVKKDETGKIAKRMIWTTKSIERALQGIEEGRKLTANPFYEGNTKLLKADLVYKRTDEEIAEWKKCANDIIYFAEKYCKILTPTGIDHVKLRDYQEKYLQHLIDNRLSVYLAARQVGKTVTTGIYLLHYICFHVDSNTLIVGNKKATSVEILDKVKKIFLELPMWLKPGCLAWNYGNVVFDNGCRIQTEAMTKNSGIGQTLSVLVWDEAAHCPPNIMEEFFENIAPTVIAQNARFIISSTQHGRNLFYRIYTAAANNESDYHAFKTDWYEVPEWNPEKQCWEKRDENWHQRQVANYGSEEAFNRQFGTNFDISSNTLIAQTVLQKKRTELIQFVQKDMLGVLYSDKYYWKPNYDPMTQLKKDYIVATIDLAEGLSGDHDNTICCFNKIKAGGKTECVGYFKSNDISREQYAYSLLQVFANFCNPIRLLISFEKNTYGDLFIQHIMDYVNGNELLAMKFDLGCFVKYYNETGTKWVYGIKLNHNNKYTHCILFKEDYERNKVVNDSVAFMDELENFSEQGNGCFKASYGHDDLVMAQMQIEFVKETLQWKMMVSEIVDEEENKTKQVEEEETIYNPFESIYDEYYSQIEQDIQDIQDIHSNQSRLQRYTGMF